MGIGILADIIFAFLIASYAGGKGRSFWFWFVLSVVLDPIIGFILLQATSFISKTLAEKSDQPIVDVNPRTVFEYQHDRVTPEELYRQSEKLYKQAAKLRDLADQIQNENHQKSVSKIINRDWT